MTLDVSTCDGLFPISGVAAERQFDQHSPHCPGGELCIGVANGMSQSIAGRCREVGLVQLNKEHHGAFEDTTYDEGSPDRLRVVIRPTPTKPTKRDRNTYYEIWDKGKMEFVKKQAPLETMREATAVLRKWRDTSHQMFLRGEWPVRTGLPESTLKKQRKESAALTLELDSTSVAEDEEVEMPSPSNADEAAVTPAASRMGDFD